MLKGLKLLRDKKPTIDNIESPKPKFTHEELRDIKGITDFEALQAKFADLSNKEITKHLSEAAQAPEKVTTIDYVFPNKIIKDENFKLHEEDTPLTSLVRMLNHTADAEELKQYNESMGGAPLTIEDAQRRDRISRAALMKIIHNNAMSPKDISKSTTDPRLFTTMTMASLTDAMVNFEFIAPHAIENFKKRKSGIKISKEDPYEDTVDLSKFVFSPDTKSYRAPIKIIMDGIYGENVSVVREGKIKGSKTDELFLERKPDATTDTVTKTTTKGATTNQNPRDKVQELFTALRDGEGKANKKKASADVKEKSTDDEYNKLNDPQFIQVDIHGDVTFKKAESKGALHLNYERAVKNEVFDKILHPDIKYALPKLEELAQGLYDDASNLNNRYSREYDVNREKFNQYITENFNGDDYLNPDEVILDVLDGNSHKYNSHPELVSKANLVLKAPREMQSEFERATGQKNRHALKSGMHTSQNLDHGTIVTIKNKGGLEMLSVDIHDALDKEATLANIKFLHKAGLLKGKMYINKKGKYVITPKIIESALNERVSPSGATSTQNAPQSGLANIMGGNRIWIYKNARSSFEISKKYGSTRDFDGYVRQLIKTSTSQIANIRNGVIRISHGNRHIHLTLLDLEKEIRSRVSDNQDAEMKGYINQKIDDVRLGHLRLKLDYITNGISLHKPRIGNSFLEKMKNAYLFSTLGGLSLTSLANDSIGHALLGSRSVKDFAINLHGYMTNLLSDLSENEIKAFQPVAEDRFIESKFSSDSSVKTKEIFNSWYAIDDITERGRYTASKSLSYNWALELMEGKVSNRMKVFKNAHGVSNEIMEYARNFIQLDTAGKPYIDFGAVSTESNHLASQLLSVRDSYVNRVIPIHGFASKAYSYKAGNMGILGDMLRAILMFKGIQFEESLSTARALNSINGLESKLNFGARVYGSSFMQSLIFNFIKDISKGKLPIIHDDEGDVDEGALFRYMRRAAIDAPALGILGGFVSSTVSGDPNNALGGMFGYMTPAAKFAKGASTIFKGDVGHGLNHIITAVNSFNPVRNIPFGGVVLDRLLIDSMRDFVYPNSDKYYKALERYASDDGTYTAYEHSGIHKSQIKDEEDNA